MQTRRDHLQAYQFAMGRLATALVSGDPGRGDSPTRRGALGTFLGAGVVVLLCAGFGVYGAISPAPKNDWRGAGSIVVEQGTGSRFLYLDGELRPVRNYASALLLTGKGAVVRSVSAASLGATAHGAPVGIADAPDALPSPGALVGATWTRCLRPDLSGGESVDFTPNGPTSPLPAGHPALLTGPDGARYVLWQGVLHPVPQAATLIALGMDADRAVPAPQSWLDTLPGGAALAAPALPGAGGPAGTVAGQPVTVGQVFSTGQGGRSYVMTMAGVASISATTAELLAALPGAGAPRQVTAAELAGAPVAPAGRLPGADLPDVLGAPQLDTGGRALCVSEHLTDGGHTVAASAVLGGGAAGTGARQVLVPANGGVLAVAREDVMAQVTDPQQYLITDQGIAFPVDGTAVALLGLGGTTPAELPRTLLAAVPHGPALTRAAAQATVGTGA